MSTYYVNATFGLDTNNGLLNGTAFKTLSGLLSTVTAFSTNTIINLAEGTYTAPNTIITKINTGVTLEIIGFGKKTIFKQDTSWGGASSGVYGVGTSGANIVFKKLIFDMTNGNSAGYNTGYCLYPSLTYYNVAFINTPNQSMGVFSPYYSNYKFYNCIFAGNYPTSCRADVSTGTLKLYNCYGYWGDGYSSSSTFWNGGNNSITTSRALTLIDADYKITNLSVAKTIGVYAGDIAPWTKSGLIKKDGLFYSILTNYYDTTTKTYLPLASADFANKFFLTDLFVSNTIDGETFMPIEKFNNFQLVFEEVATDMEIKAIKTNMQMIVANDDIPVSIASNIDSFTLTSSASSNADIRIAFSIDKGSTWNTINSTTGLVETLSITIPKMNYNQMTISEKANWNIAKDTINTNGIQPSAFNTFNFNTLNAENIRFAYVLRRDAYVEVSETYGLAWQFDAKGALRMMIPGTEYITDVYEHQIKLQTLISNPIIKVNLMV